VKRIDLAQEILSTVPRERLIAAIAFILAERHRRATGASDDAPVSLDMSVLNDVEGFMATATVRQLKLLRKIALGLDLEKVTEH